MRNKEERMFLEHYKSKTIRVKKSCGWIQQKTKSNLKHIRLYKKLFNHYVSGFLCMYPCSLSHVSLFAIPRRVEIFQSRILEQVAISHLKGSSWPMDQTPVLFEHNYPFVFAIDIEMFQKSSEMFSVSLLSYPSLSSWVHRASGFPSSLLISIPSALWARRIHLAQ